MACNSFAIHLIFTPLIHTQCFTIDPFIHSFILYIYSCRMTLISILSTPSWRKYFLLDSNNNLPEYTIPLSTLSIIFDEWSFVADPYSCSENTIPITDCRYILSVDDYGTVSEFFTPISFFYRFFRKFYVWLCVVD